MITKKYCKMKKPVETFKEFTLCQITDKKELNEISQLVVKVNYSQHLNQQLYPLEELAKIYQEDLMALSNSIFYAIYDKHSEIIAAVKCQKCNQNVVLAIEKDFNVDLRYFINGMDFKPGNIFHIGRFVVDQYKIRKNSDLRQKRLTILKLLMYYALKPVFEHSTNIFFCECDEKLFSKLNLLGLYPKIIGASKEYLGSKTIPIYCDHNGITEFFELNRNVSHVS